MKMSRILETEKDILSSKLQQTKMEKMLLTAFFSMGGVFSLLIFGIFLTKFSLFSILPYACFTILSLFLAYLWVIKKTSSHQKKVATDLLDVTLKIEAKEKIAEQERIEESMMARLQRDAEISARKNELRGHAPKVNNSPSYHSFCSSSSFPKEFTEPKKQPETKSERAKIEAQIQELVGLSEAKARATKFMNFVQTQNKRKKMDLQVAPIKYHMMFKGAPGTGKTTLARLFATYMHSIGALSKGHLVEVDRSDIVGTYIGHTEDKMGKILKQAKGGILYIDEAYSLAINSENDYGKVAIDILIKVMEDEPDMMVILSGYTEKMNKLYKVNSGFKSRVPHNIIFDNYNVEELNQISDLFLSKWQYQMEPKAEEKFNEFIQLSFAQGDTLDSNGRWVRNSLEKIKMEHAERMGPKENPTKEELMTLTLTDVEKAIILINKENNEEKLSETV